MSTQPLSRPQQLLAVARRGARSDELTDSYRLPGRGADAVSWPDWVGPTLRAAFAARGIDSPWSHQAQAAEAAWHGRHTVIATGTASGKSLAFLLPALQALLDDERASVLYLAPTKALAADQAGTLAELAIPGIRPAGYDGDTGAPDRAWAREHARYLLTNPDMLHYGILPYHQRWARLLRRLRYVIVDECHSYFGLFGSHVALVLRRLLRLAQHYGAQPVGICASATIADPGPTAARLLGVRQQQVLAVTDDTSPAPARDILLWRPGVHDREDAEDVMPDAREAGTDRAAPARRISAATAAGAAMANLVAAGARTLTFVRSRQGTEYVALQAKRRLERIAPERAERIAAYRGGFLAEHRRELERDLDSGKLLGVASTTALELGVDISGLDAVVIAGFPGSMASWWQQAGRAGRGGPTDPDALVVFIARDDPLDAFLVSHGEQFLAAPVENSVINPDNPHLLAAHLCCAAAELPIREEDLTRFGSVAVDVLADLVASAQLRRRPTGWYRTALGHPANEVDLRGTGGQVVIGEVATGRMLGTANTADAPSLLHPGAVYLHQGEQFLVSDLDLAQHMALVESARVDYSTMSLSTNTVQLGGAFTWPDPPGTGACPHEHVIAGFGPLTVTSQVIGFQRRRADGELIDTTELALPPTHLHTEGLAITVPGAMLLAAGVAAPAIGSALHAAEHAAIGLLPLFVGCDARDVGGVSSAAHPDTALPTIVLYDGLAGGAGFTKAGYLVLGRWLRCVREAVAHCPCEAGCPSCVQSPHCGSGNQRLFKDGAVLVLDLLTSALDR